MRTILKYTFIICVVSLLAGCHDTNLYAPQAETTTPDGVEISLLFPEMPTVATRTIGAVDPKLDDLDLFLFVFDGTNLLQTIRIDRTETMVAKDKNVKFKAYLPQTDDNAVIHIIAIDDSDRKFSEQVDAVGYGIEDMVMSSFSVSNQQDAYWARIVLGCPIVTTVENEDNPLDKVEGTEAQVQEVFKHPIPLIRNFAKVSVTKPVTATNFEILGWCIVNALDAGSVVPWFSRSGNADIEFPEYATWNDSEGKNKPKSYSELSAQGYRGVSQTGASRLYPRTEDLNVLTNADFGSGAKFNANAKYIYERHTVSVNPLYLILYVQVTGASGVSNGSYYYKVALGHTDSESTDDYQYGTGLFTEYNVLRNIEYTVNITSVTGAGYTTAAEAAEGPAFNNISGDVVTRNLLSISDGVDMLYVNAMTFVITTDQQADDGIDFRYRYVTNIIGSQEENNDLVYWNNSVVGAIEPGVVIKSVTDDEFTDPRNGTKWKSFHITTEHPTTELKQQTFTVYSAPNGDLSDPTKTMGLSRTITLVLRQPWDFINVQTYPGLWGDDTKYPTYNPGTTPSEDDVNYFIGPEKGAELTIFFELPAGLPESIFPLNVTIESDRQNIENAGVGNAVVETGPSLFDGVTDNRIKFVKTINWSDYAPDGENSTAQSRIQRARFITTTSISSLVDDEKISTVIVHNPYFNDGMDKFKRDQNTPVTN